MSVSSPRYRRTSIAFWNREFGPNFLHCCHHRLQGPVIESISWIPLKGPIQVMTVTWRLRSIAWQPRSFTRVVEAFT